MGGLQPDFALRRGLAFSKGSGLVMQIADNTAVLIHYTLKNDAGEVLDSSEGEEALAYIHGQGDLVEGLEAALAGKTKGTKLSVKVSPAQGYGLREDDKVRVVPRAAFEDDSSIEPGMRFQTRTEEGVEIVTVTQVTLEEITIDANHPLAGETLNFEVEIVDVRKATPEELAHGHIHGAGGHHH
jgi:FKBP-type peptidyl-prolyl cis-trans isomerase SlyD